MHSNHRSIPASESERNAILDLADRMIAGSTLHGAVRATLRGRRGAILVEHPGGGCTNSTFLIRTLDRATTHLIYPGMLHVGTKVVLEIPTFKGPMLRTWGIVQSCRHISLHMHDIYVAFDKPIDLSPLLPPDVIFSDASDTAEQPVVLKARCFVMGASELESSMIAHFLGATEIESHQCSTTGAVTDLLAREEIDLAILDKGAIGADHARFLVDIGRLGVRAALMLVPNNSNIREDTSVASVRTSELRRPINPAELLGTLTHLLHELELHGEPDVRCSMRNADNEAIIRAYVAQLGDDIERASKARESGDIEKLRGALISWRDTGATFGFAALTRCALQAITAIDASGSIEDASLEIRRTLTVARRIRDAELEIGGSSSAAA